MSSRPRAVFFGSPAFAVPTLSALLQIAEVTLVVTQPDRPAGRGLALRKPPVKECAEAAGVRLIQPTKVRTAEFAELLRAESAEVGVVIAYGRILPRAVLDAPRQGCVNLHASLLPRWRGAAPIQWAIARGDRETGVCLMQMDEGMDTGPVISSESVAIEPNETAGELSERLSLLSAAVLQRDLPRFLAGELQPEKQPEAGVTLAPLLEKSHGRIDWSRPAREVHDLVRGMNPWPLAFTFAGDRRVRIHRSRVEASEGTWASAGELLRSDSRGLHVACGRGVLAIEELQLDGKRRLPAPEFLAGVPWEVGLQLGEETS